MTLDELLRRYAKKLQGLHPVVAAKAEQLLRRTYAEGIYIGIVHGFRTMAEQAAIYAQGRSVPGPIATNARPGESYHNYGLAVDFALLTPDWSDYIWNERDPKWKRAAAIGKELGFEWGGDWRSFKDYPHLEYTFGLSIKQLQSGVKPPQQDVIPEGEDNIMELKENWQWTMLGDAITALSRRGVVGYEWAEKAYQHKLTNSEAAWLSLIVQARIAGDTIEPRS